MAAKKRIPAPKKPDIAPEAPEAVDLLTLTESQAKQVMQAVMVSRQADARAKELSEKVQELLAMVAPVGANGFDFERMTFQSVPPQAPPQED